MKKAALVWALKMLPFLILGWWLGERLMQFMGV